MTKLVTIDLSEGFEDTKSAQKALQYAIASNRATGVPVLKVLHATPQTPGDVSKLQRATRNLLKRYKREDRIRFFIFGENLDEADGTTRYLLDKYPYVAEEDAAFGTQDASYTIVCI